MPLNRLVRVTGVAEQPFRYETFPFRFGPVAAGVGLTWFSEDASFPRTYLLFAQIRGVRDQEGNITIAAPTQSDFEGSTADRYHYRLAGTVSLTFRTTGVGNDTTAVNAFVAVPVGTTGVSFALNSAADQRLSRGFVKLPGTVMLLPAVGADRIEYEIWATNGLVGIDRRWFASVTVRLTISDALDTLASEAVDWDDLTYIGARGYTAANRDHEPSVAQINAESAPEFYVLNPSGQIGLSWDIDSATFSRSPVNRAVLTVSGGKLVSDDFLLGQSTGIAFSFLTRTPLGDAVTKRLWAEIREQGGSAGLVQVGLTESDPEPFVTGVQALATFTVRTDFDVLIPLSVIDDLGRQWDVSSYRFVGDRRFMEIEGFRTLRQDQDV